MEAWAIWLDVLPYIVHGVELPADIAEMLGLLREGALYFLRYREGQHTLSQIDAAQDKLLRYAAMAEERFGGFRLMTPLLHTLVVHIPAQARALGPTAFCAEFWVERTMQEMKRVTKYRSTVYPELLAVNSWLIRAALRQHAAQHEGLRELAGSMHAVRHVCGNHDTMDEDGVVLIGSLHDGHAGGQVCYA